MTFFLSLDIIRSSKLEVFLESRSCQTVHFSEKIISADNYPNIFLRCRLPAWQAVEREGRLKMSAGGSRMLTPSITRFTRSFFPLPSLRRPAMQATPSAVTLRDRPNLWRDSSNPSPRCADLTSGKIKLKLELRKRGTDKNFIFDISLQIKFCPNMRRRRCNNNPVSGSTSRNAGGLRDDLSGGSKPVRLRDVLVFW